MRLFLILCILLLSGCATTQKYEPTYEYVKDNTKETEKIDGIVDGHWPVYGLNKDNGSGGRKIKDDCYTESQGWGSVIPNKDGIY